MGVNIVSHLMKGPQAVEHRLRELDREFLHTKQRFMNLTTWKFRLRPLGLAKTIGTEVLRRTLQEIRAERRALRALLGNHLRPWEIKDSGPAPTI